MMDTETERPNLSWHRFAYLLTILNGLPRTFKWCLGRSSNASLGSWGALSGDCLITPKYTSKHVPHRRKLSNRYTKYTEGFVSDGQPCMYGPVQVFSLKWMALPICQYRKWCFKQCKTAQTKCEHCIDKTRTWWLERKRTEKSPIYKKCWKTGRAKTTGL